MNVTTINSSTTSVDPTDEPLAWTFSNEYAKLAISHVMMLIEVLGFAGTVLVFLVARYLVKVEKKIGFLMLCYISITDMVNVAGELLFHVTKVYSIYTVDNVPLLCDVYLFAKGIVHRGASFLILAMTVERFYATYYPFNYKDNVSAKLLTIVATLCMIPPIFSCTLVAFAFGNENGYCFEARSGVSPFIFAIINFENLVLNYILIGVLVVIFNVLIVVKIRRRKTTQSAEQQQANSAASKMLFVLAGVLLTSNIASAIIAYTLWILVEMKSDLSVQGLIFLEILQYMYPLALFANSTANFPILLITMKKFRETLKIILGMKK